MQPACSRGTVITMAEHGAPASDPDEPKRWAARVDGFVLVERAAGILMQHHRWPADRAHEELAARARQRGETVIETAFRIVLGEHGL